MNKKIYLPIIWIMLFNCKLNAQFVTEIGLGASFSNPIMSNKINTEKHVFQQYAGDRTGKLSIGYKFKKFYPYFNMFRISSSMSFNLANDVDKETGYNIKLNYFSRYRGIGLLYQFYKRDKKSMNIGIEFGTLKFRQGGGNYISNTDSIAFMQTNTIYYDNKRQYMYGLKYQFEYAPIKNSIGLEVFYNRSTKTIYKFHSEFQINNYTGSFDTQSKAGQMYIGINYKIYWYKNKPKEEIPDIESN